MPYKIKISKDLDYYEAGSSYTPPNMYAKGTYNTFFESNLGIAYAAWTTSLMIYQDFEVFAPIVLDAIRFVTNSNPAGQASFTLYNATTSGQPDQKLVEVTFDTSSPTGSQVITFAEQTLQPGIYFWAIQSSSNFNLWTTQKSSNQFAFLGRETGVGLAPLLQKYISPHVYATPTPSTATAPNNSYYGGPVNVFFVQGRIKA